MDIEQVRRILADTPTESNLHALELAAALRWLLEQHEVAVRTLTRIARTTISVGSGGGGIHTKELTASDLDELQLTELSLPFKAWTREALAALGGQEAKP